MKPHSETWVIRTALPSGVRRNIWETSHPIAYSEPSKNGKRAQVRWILERTKTGFRARDLKTGIWKEFPTPSSAHSASISFSDIRWVLNKKHWIPAYNTQTITTDIQKISALVQAQPVLTSFELMEQRELKRSLKFTGIAFSLLMMTALLFPKADPTKEELLPAQYAKVVLKPATKTAQSSSSQNSDSGSQPKTAQQAAVVQAFRAKVVQNNMKGLLKGGMTRLLAQSQALAGKTLTDSAKKIFNSSSLGSLAQAPVTGLNSIVSAKVGSVGGGSGNGAGGVGYGSGTHASVGGQGQGYVALDTGGSSIDEGLSKDEVGRIIHQHMAEVRYCYESAIVRNPEVEGKLMVDFTIQGSGTVKTASVKTSTLPDSQLDDCIIRRLTQWKFPQPKGGVLVAVSYPFIFKTMGR